MKGATDTLERGIDPMAQSVDCSTITLLPTTTGVKIKQKHQGSGENWCGKKCTMGIFHGGL